MLPVIQESFQDTVVCELHGTGFRRLSLRAALRVQVFKKYVTMLLTRVNTITGVQYSQDPTIFALELANEPHTTDGYEAARGIPVGSIVREWIKEMVATIRLVDSKHMVS